MCECNTYFNLENSTEFFFLHLFCTALCFFVRVYVDHRTTESLILLNYAPENVLHPFLLPSLPQPCLLHSFSPSSSLGKPLSRQFLIGSRGTNPLHHPGRGKEAGYFASVLLLRSSGCRRLGEFLSSLSQSDSCCVVFCVCALQVTILRGKDGYGFTICSDSPVRVQAVDPGKFFREDDGEFPLQRSLLCSKKIHTYFVACVTYLLNILMSGQDGTLFFFYIMRTASLHLDCRNYQTSHVRLSVPPPPGGPADQAGLQQLDTLLQLNGQPVEQWKCVDLAHAIRYQDTCARAALEKRPF